MTLLIGSLNKLTSGCCLCSVLYRSNPLDLNQTLEMILQFNLLSFVGPDVLHLRPDEAVEVRGRVVRIADDQGLVLPPELVGGHAPAKPVRGNEFAELGKEKSKEFVMNSFVLKLKSSLNVFG